MLVLSAALTALCPAASWQATPIQLSATPNAALVGADVNLTGRTIGSKAGLPVELRVTPPQSAGAAPPDKLMVTTAADGTFSRSLGGIGAPGVYKIDALVDGHDSGISAQITVYSPSELQAAIQVLLAQSVTLALDTAAIAEDKLGSLPPSPLKDEAIREFEVLRRQTAALQGDVASTAGAVSDILAASSTVSSLEAGIATARQKFLSLMNTTSGDVDYTATSVMELRNADVACDQLAAITRATGNVAKVFEDARDLLYLAGQIADGIHTIRARHETHEAGTLDKALEKATHVLGTYRKIADACAQWELRQKSIYSKTMAGFCVRFGGKVTAAMQAHFFEQGREWWSYSFTIVGQLTVNFPREKHGATIPVSGDFRGEAAAFTVAENSLAVMWPNYAQSTVLKTLVLPTGGGGERFPVVLKMAGTANDSEIRLKVASVVQDFKVSARVLTLALNVTAMMPQFINYELPYKNAEFLFQHATDEYVLPFYVVDAARMKATLQVERQRDNDVAHGHYSVSGTLCSPDC